MPRVPLKERLSYSTYASLGWSHRQIARRFKRKRATIERWLDPDRKDGEDFQRSGRPRSTTPQEDKKVVNQYRRCWRKKSMGRRAISQELKNPESKMPKISGDTAYRRLQEAGGEMKVKQKRFPLTDRHKRLRVKFAADMKEEDFDLWLWSDETDFEVGSRKRKVFHFPGEELEETKFRHPITQKVWACVSAGGPGAVVFFDGTLNAEKYKDILANRLQKTAKKLFGKSEWKVVCFTIPVLIFCFLVSI